MGLFGNDLKNQKLISFSNSCGGGMNGGIDSLEIYIFNEEAYLKQAKSDWWYEDEKVIEYMVDKSVLDEIEAIFRKHGMEKWNNKKFTNMFVNDAPNYRYTFGFDGRISISFSSQIYPERYDKKLKEIRDIIQKYKESAKAVPGLVSIDLSEERQQYKRKPDNGSVEIEVYKYGKNVVYYRIMNGTSEEVDIKGSVKILDENGTVLFFDNGEDEKQIDANSSLEKYIKLSSRLEEGEYTIDAGICSSKFVIALNEK